MDSTAVSLEKVAEPSLLTLGQILDRAVTLIARNILPLLVIVAVVAVPLAVISYFTSPSWAELGKNIGTVLARPDRQTFGDLLKQWQLWAATHHRDGRLTALYWIVSAIVSPLSYGAAIVAIAAAYDHLRIAPVTAYRSAIARWPSLIVVGLAFLLMTLAYMIIGIIVLTIGAIGLAVAIVALHARAFSGLAVVGFILIATPIFLIPFAWGTLAYYFSLVGVATGRFGSMASIRAAFSRTLRPGYRVRSFLCSLVIVSIIIAVAIVNMFAAGVLLRFGAPPAIIQSVGTVLAILSSIAIIGFVTVAYIDTRVRAEGLDIEAVT